MSTEPTREPEQPVFRITRGNPTDEELAALVAVLTALAAPAERPSSVPPPAGGWSAYWRAVRAPLSPGPDAWGASGRPA